METPLFVAALLLCARALFHKQWRQLGLWLGLATLIRPEGIIATGIVVFLLLLRERPALRALLVYWGMSVLPWVLFAMWYYGSPIPNSVSAKRAVYNFDQLHAFLELMAAAGKSLWPDGGFLKALLTFTILVWLTLIGVYHTLRQGWQEWFIPLFFIAYATFLVVANPLFFEWYATPFVPFGLLLIAHALERGFLPHRASILMLAIVGWQMFLWITGRADVVFVQQYERLALYSDAANWLAAHGGQAATIAASEIGSIGYQLPEAGILDTVGLVSPRSVPYHAGLLPDQLLTNNAIPPLLIRDECPEFVVSLDVFTRASLLPDPAFQSNYEEVYKQPTDVFGSHFLQIFQRLGDTCSS